jgi:hypothetical protein
LLELQMSSFLEKTLHNRQSLFLYNSLSDEIE